MNRRRDQPTDSRNWAAGAPRSPTTQSELKRDNTSAAGAASDWTRGLADIGLSPPKPHQPNPRP